MLSNFITDPNTAAFVKAAGITGGTEYMALNYLVLALKTNNLWNRIFAIYPFVGGTATTHKYNLKNPSDTNSAFRLTFTGATHNANGVTYSVTNGGSNTFLTPTVTFTGLNNKETMAVYSRSPFSAATGGVDMGTAVSISQRDELILRSNLNGAGVSMNSTTAGAGNCSYAGETNGSGFLLATRQTPTDLRTYKNGVLKVSATTTNDGTRSNIQMYLGCRNVTNIPQGFTGRNFGLALIAAEYTPSEAVILSNIVEQYQVYLNRSSLDTDANAFIESAAITGQTQIDAVYTLVRELKEKELWNKMSAVYPFVGGTAVSHSYNLRNPAQFQITWNGTVTHSANGAVGNGTNGYGNTNLNPSTTLSLNDTHISYYSRTATNDTTAFREWGAISNTTNKLEMLIRFNNTLRTEVNTNTPSAVANTNGAVFFVGSRRSSANQQTYINGSLFNDDTTNTSSGLPNANLLIMALNNAGAISFWNTRQVAFASVGTGLSDADNLNLYNIVQRFNTTLSRQN